VDISKITEFLYVGAEPSATDAPALARLEFRLLISMIGGWPPPKELSAPPLNLLWLASYDTFVTPIRMDKLARGVRAARRVIESRGRVLVFCHQGRHRSVVMASAILIAGGLSAEQAMALISSRRAIADPYAWYIRRQIVKFETSWQASGKAEQLGFEELDV